MVYVSSGVIETLSSYMVIQSPTPEGLFQRACDSELLWTADSYESLDLFLDPFSGLFVLFCASPHTLDSASSFQVEFEVPYERQRITLNLQPSRHVVSRLTTVQHINSTDNHGAITDIQSQRPLLYKGVAFVNDIEKQTQRRVGWARVMMRYRQGRHVIEGTFTNDGTYHHISLDSNYRQARQIQDGQLRKRSERMVVWKQTRDESEGALSQRSSSDEPTCQAHRYNDRRRQASDDQDTHRPLLARQDVNDWFDPRDVIGSTEGCPNSRRVALIGIAADCSYTAEFDNMQDARDNIVSQVNIASQVYEDTFNIALAIQNLTISDPSCPSDAPRSMPWNLPCTASVDINDRLNLFTQWRGRLRDDNAVWSLFSACRSGSTVGIAWIGSLCNRSRGSSWGRGGTASANVVVRTASEWQVFAHELAHNLGASHDCTSGDCGTSGYSPSDDCCPRSETTCDARNQYIMNPQSSPGLEEFSPCTIGTICTGIGEEHVDTSCLVSENEVPDINDSQCGNGIVEPGESCDCGAVPSAIHSQMDAALTNAGSLQVAWSAVKVHPPVIPMRHVTEVQASVRLTYKTATMMRTQVVEEEEEEEEEEEDQQGVGSIGTGRLSLRPRLLLVESL
ncbi:ADAM protease [Fusarium bulbicola]|nr:ADAM protease [Fusarium bulbicola]